MGSIPSWIPFFFWGGGGGGGGRFLYFFRKLVFSEEFAMYTLAHVTRLGCVAMAHFGNYHMQLMLVTLIGGRTVQVEINNFLQMFSTKDLLRQQLATSL